jgi:hypothetical protein
MTAEAMRRRSHSLLVLEFCIELAQPEESVILTLLFQSLTGTCSQPYYIHLSIAASSHASQQHGFVVCCSLLSTTS